MHASAQSLASSGDGNDDVLNGPRESMDYDVVIVGAGPAGLAAGIQLRQRAAQTGKELSVCIVEKGSEVGAHILSGNVFETRALDALLPDWKERGAPLDTPVTEDQFLVLPDTKSSYAIPNALLPPQLVDQLLDHLNFCLCRACALVPRVVVLNPFVFQVDDQ